MAFLKTGLGSRRGVAAILYGVAALWMITLASPGRADLRDSHLRFDATWYGLPVGAGVVSLSRTATGWTGQARAAGKGVVGWITKFGVTAHHAARIDTATGLRSTVYGYQLVTRRRERSVDVVYGDTAAETRARIETKGSPAARDREREDAVPVAERNGLDPLAALHLVLEYARAPAPASLRLPVYDGPRRYDLLAAHRGRTEVKLGDRTLAAHHIRIRTVPLFGFKPKHAKEWRRDSYDLYVRADGPPLPLKLDARKSGLVIHFVKACDTAQACALPK